MKINTRLLSQIFLKNSKKAFTLVELIVVITILAILGTIAFIAFQSYTVYARDVVRTADLGSISRAITIKIAQGGYAPKPENPVEITSSGTLVMYQGEFTQEMGKKFGVNGDLVDPLDGKNYTYSTDTYLFKHELAGFLEGETSSNSIISESYAGTGRTILTKGDKLGIIFTPEEVPIQELSLLGDTLDIVTTNDTYKVYFDNNDIIEGTGSVLYTANPKANCKRIFELGNGRLGSGEYAVTNPYGEDLTVFCDIRHQDKTFYTSIVDGDFENPYSDNWGAYTKTIEDSVSGNNSLKFIGSISGGAVANDYTYVQSGKKYTLEGTFRGIGTVNSRIFFGFIEYDENFELIRTQDVRVMEGTETTLLSDVSSGDNVIMFEDTGNTCSSWYDGGSSQFDRYGSIVFNTDNSGGYGDLPNRERSSLYGFDSIVDNGSSCTLTLDSGLNIDSTYLEGTSIRMHGAHGTYNYGAASNKYAADSWVTYSGSILGEAQYGDVNDYFRKGTRFIKVLILGNAGQTTDSVLLVDDLKLVEY